MFSTQIEFGCDSGVQLRLPPETCLVDCSPPRDRVLQDVSAAVAAMLDEPLDFPALASATVPGDQIVLAVDHEVPQAAAVVAGVVHSLVESAAAPENITLVQSNLDSGADRQPLTSRLRADIRGRVNVLTHDPSDRRRLTYIAASREGKPIYLNRAVADADLLIPIGCIRPVGSLGYLGVSGGLFPTFADLDTQRRFYAPNCVYSSVHQRRRRDEAAEALWLLGSRFALQLISGSGDQVLHVLAGEVDAVAARGRQLAETAWNCAISRRSAMVVAAIEGGREQQTWPNVARALSAASRIVDEDGSVVLCTDLQEDPGPSLARLAGSDTLVKLQRDINRDRTPDALPASQLVRALGQAKVYLLSRLEADVVEGLGLGYVNNVEDIFRLANRHASCTFLANAQHAVPTLKEELVGR